MVYPNQFLEHLAPGRFHYLGIKALDFPLEEGDLVIQMWEWKAENLKHFTVADHEGNIIYDPIEGGSKTVKNGVLRSIRVIRPLH